MTHNTPDMRAEVTRYIQCVLTAYWKECPTDLPILDMREYMPVDTLDVWVPGDTALRKEALRTGSPSPILAMLVAPNAFSHERWMAQAREAYKEVRYVAMYRITRTISGLRVHDFPYWTPGNVQDLANAMAPGTQMGVVYRMAGEVALQDFIMWFRASLATGEMGVVAYDKDTPTVVIHK